MNMVKESIYQIGMQSEENFQAREPVTLDDLRSQLRSV